MQVPSQPLPFVVAAATLVSTVAAQTASSQVFPTQAQGQMHGWAVGIQIGDAMPSTTPPELRVWQPASNALGGVRRRERPAAVTRAAQVPRSAAELRPDTAAAAAAGRC